MRIFDILSKRQKTQEAILEELKKINERKEMDVSIFREIHDDLSILAKKNGEFVEVIRHFFALERTKSDEEKKRQLEEIEDAKPGKHDFTF